MKTRGENRDKMPTGFFLQPFAGGWKAESRHRVAAVTSHARRFCLPRRRKSYFPRENAVRYLMKQKLLFL